MTDPPTAPSKPPFQFGLRDIAWAVLMVAMAVGWWLDREELRAALQREKAHVLDVRMNGSYASEP